MSEGYRAPLAAGSHLIERAYWLNRQQKALAMARCSSDAAGRTVHIELARRYGLEAQAAQVRKRSNR